MRSPYGSRRKYFISKNKEVRKIVNLQYQKSLERKMKEENKALKREQKEYRDFILNGKKEVQRKQPPITDSKETISLMNVEDTPYLSVQAGTLWKNLVNVWLGFKIGKRMGEEGGDDVEKRKQKEYAVNIQNIQDLLRLPVEDFERLGLSKYGAKYPDIIKKYINDKEYLGEDI